MVVVDEMPEVGLFAPDHYGGVPMSIAEVERQFQDWIAAGSPVEQA